MHEDFRRALQYHRRLPPRILQYLRRERGLADQVIHARILGFNGWRITIPIFDRQRRLAFFKLAKDPADTTDAPKMLAGRGSHAELYGWERLRGTPQEIVICEGEFDRLVLESHGFAAVTGTAGAGTFPAEWAEAFREIPRVYVCFDRDEAGRKGAERVAALIPLTRIVELPEAVGEGGDVTDFFVRLGRHESEFRALLDAAKRPVIHAQEVTIPQPRRPPVADSETERLKIRGTLIVDEGDFRYSDEKAELVKILNNGNGRGFPVLRTETVNGRELKPRAYQVYGPKLIATRGFFQDRALESRCLTEEMGGRRPREDIAISLEDGYKAEALALRDQLLMFRFRNLGRLKPDPALVDRTVEPRLAQVFVPLMSIMEDVDARQSLRELMHQYQRDLVADRGMELEARVLEAIRELQKTPNDTEIAVKEIAVFMAEKHGEDFGRRITPHWVGYFLRRKLGLKTEKRHGSYLIAQSECRKLVRLFEKYGILPVAGDLGDSGDFAGELPLPPAPQS